MSPITALRNPIDPAKDLIFVITNNGRLDLITGNEDPIGVPLAVKGNIPMPSSIASVLYRQKVLVFGITTVTGDDANGKYQITLLSPVERPLLNARTNSRSIAATTIGEDCWLYFLDPSNQLRQISVQISSNEALTVDNKPSAQTYLTAFSDSSGNPWVIYQSELGAIHVLDVQGHDNKTILLENNSKLNSPLAVTVYKAEKEEIVFVYYINPNNLLTSLRRINGTWSKDSVKTAFNFQDRTFSAVSRTDIRANDINYLTTSGEYHHVRDNF